MRKKLGRTLAWVTFSVMAVLVIAEAGADDDFPKDHIFEDDIFIGDSNAPVTLVMYASPTCIHCKGFFRVWYPDVKAEYIDSGYVRMIFREIPTGNARFTQSGSILARCATETRGVEAYVRTFDEFYPDPEPGARPPNPNQLVQYAVGAGFEQEEAAACLQRDDIEATYERNAAHAAQVLKVSGTPAFVVDGEVVPLDYEVNLLFREEHRLAQLIDDLLAERGIDVDGLGVRKEKRAAFLQQAESLEVDLSPSALAVEDKILLKLWEHSKQRDLTASEKQAFSEWDARYNAAWNGFGHYLDANGARAMAQIAGELRKKSL